MKKLTHIDRQGRARMVDVTGKPATKRVAIARGSIRMKPETLQLITENKVPKGDVLSTARIAGIMAAKKTCELIPMCHPLNLTSVSVDFTLDGAKEQDRYRGAGKDCRTDRGRDGGIDCRIRCRFDYL